MTKLLEGSRAIAETIKLCRPSVVAVYPITPQTHIVENLAMFCANGQADYEYIKAESEMAAASIVLGASATGARVYTASASQGLLLMTEVLFNIAGLRLPVVMTCANRAVSAPINIWNDQQDAMTIRDAGWIMLFAENNQEAADLHIQAYKIAEQTNLPVMVCIDGFSLTHTFEPVNIPDQKLVDKFLPNYKPKPGAYLDPKNPISIGVLSNPANYMLIREKLHQDLLASKKIIQKTALEFDKIFKKSQKFTGLIEYTGPAKPKVLIIAMGSVLGTIRATIQSGVPTTGVPAKVGQKVGQLESQQKLGVTLLSQGLQESQRKLGGIQESQRKLGGIGLLKITCFRPFPTEEITTILLKLKPKKIAVIDRAISLGHGGILANEIKNLCHGKQVANFILGLGGKDIRPQDIQKIIKDTIGQKTCVTKFIL